VNQNINRPMRPSATPNPRPGKKAGFKPTPFLAGLAAGLLAAAVLALYITQSPLPFVDRIGTSKPSSPKAGPTGRVDLPDPNKSILPKDAGEVESVEEAGLEGGGRVVSPSGVTYLLQVGAFKTTEDAEQIRARMAILGFEARVSQTERDGVQLNRVRLGPYSSIEELNKAKQRLSENGIDSIVIRVNVGNTQQ
jgi:hypothetical protein